VAAATSYEGPLLPLHAVPVGATAEIAAIIAEHPIRWRLLDLGLVPGTRVEVVRRSPLQDPVLYRFRSTQMALRNSDAAWVQVRLMAPARQKDAASRHVRRSRPLRKVASS
jgi:ferrous iron transport protein A